MGDKIKFNPISIHFISRCGDYMSFEIITIQFFTTIQDKGRFVIPILGVTNSGVMGTHHGHTLQVGGVWGTIPPDSQRYQKSPLQI